MYYKYVERITNVGTGDDGRSSVLSTDPAGLRRTLVGQVLDRPLFDAGGGTGTAPAGGRGGGGHRTRLALVLCTPKRSNHPSPRTPPGTTAETIYHFQILLEGAVDEDALPSSHQGLCPVRVVGGAGGVQGGNMVASSPDLDGEEWEVDRLNRLLWGDRPVVGLARGPMSPPRGPGPGAKGDDLGRILGVLGEPLFDTLGNRAPSEAVVDRALYNLYSGRLSMEVARTTRDSVEAMADSAEWFAGRIEGLTGCISDSAARCEDQLLAGLENDEFESLVVSKLGIAQSRSKW